MRLQKAALNIAFNFGQGKSKALVCIYINGGRKIEERETERRGDALKTIVLYQRVYKAFQFSICCHGGDSETGNVYIPAENGG